MTFPDLTADLKAKLPDLKGRLAANVPLADITWFRVGGPAQVLFTPADEADLAYFLKHAPGDLPVTVVGLGSNLLVRDGGVPGIVIDRGDVLELGVEIGMPRELAAEPQVLGNRHAREDAAPLRGLRDAEPRNLVRGQLGDVPSVEHDAALARARVAEDRSRLKASTTVTSCSPATGNRTASI